MLGNETVTVVRPGGRDQYGDPTGTATEFTVPGCLFAPGPSRELGLGAQQTVSDGTVYAPPGTDVRATDRVRVAGVLYSVVGDPQNWGAAAGVVVVLRKT